MDPVQETIDICLQQGTPTAQSLELVDRTVFLLQISSSLIDNFMFAIRSSSATSFVLAGELQEVLSQLLVQWETELLHLEGRYLQSPHIFTITTTYILRTQHLLTFSVFTNISQQNTLP